MELYDLIAQSKYFDKEWYLKENEDVANFGMDPIKHYIAYGWQESRDPCAEFDNDAYLEKYQDARDMGVAPLLHYEARGKYQRRSLTGVLSPIIKEKSGNNTAKKVIYTCITGDYISLFDHRYQNLDWDYIAFTDNEELIQEKKRGQWTILPLPEIDLDESEDRKSARYVKINAHKILKNYTYSVWVDGNIDILSPKLFDRFNELIQENIAVSISQHNERDCIYDEAEACKFQMKDTEESIDKHMQILIADNYPKHNGLFNTATVFRKHHETKSIDLMTMWWHMVKNYSKRDQLSLCYCAWKLGIDITPFFNTPTLEMYYDYIQIMQGFLYIETDPITGKKIITKSMNK